MSGLSYDVARLHENNICKQQSLHKNLTELINSKTIGPHKITVKTDAHLSLSLFLSFFLFRNDTCKIMVGCLPCTYPSFGAGSQ